MSPVAPMTTGTVCIFHSFLISSLRDRFLFMFGIAFLYICPQRCCDVYQVSNFSCFKASAISGKLFGMVLYARFVCPNIILFVHLSKLDMSGKSNMVQIPNSLCKFFDYFLYTHRQIYCTIL